MPRILVVDDDEGVRELAVSVLENLGYLVVSAKDGTEALSILDKEGPVDLLFTDIVMPGSLSGYALARRAKAMCPEIKVLYTTGYSASVLDEVGVLGATLDLIEMAGVFHGSERAGGFHGASINPTQTANKDSSGPGC